MTCIHTGQSYASTASNIKQSAQFSHQDLLAASLESEAI